MAETPNNMDIQTSLARTYKLESGNLHVLALRKELQERAHMLGDDEIMILASIKEKLNSGLPDKIKQAADTVGGFVW
ncbi:hypothetical protein DB30_00661 [Enhygromyxa salina]|uniref:Uncharacterized protein n=1 Tax=Enhygromyxa salina TaxID=215803 RepID=A0A0C2D5D2_9BACT|nr:hypothetical protein [Enhygromyxa salina]KIG18376.1 hypothetical protein DB30_00661 [Enhygromyxa salina]